MPRFERATYPAMERAGVDTGGRPQACLPYLRAEWVRDVRDLAVDGWDDLDLTLPS